VRLNQRLPLAHHAAQLVGGEVHALQQHVKPTETIGVKQGTGRKAGSLKKPSS
jgi:hypothetical protein